MKKAPLKRRPFPRIPIKKRPKQKRVPGQRRYRRVKVLKPCVVRLIFLVPLAILAIERYLGFIISLDDVRDVYYDQMGIDPYDYTGTLSEPLSPVVDLANLTYTPPLQCPRGQRRMMSAHNPQFYGLSYRKIPNIIHQTATSRCLTRTFDRATVKWAFRRYSYYFHDQNAVQRVVNSEYPEFPQLKLLRTASCLTPPLTFGLWKYLVLWTYGGIVADLNTYPSSFNASTLSNEDDGFFLLEKDDSETLSTLVMAVSPRHPLIYYAIQRSMSNIMRMQSKGKYNVHQLVGERALQQALEDFLRASSTTTTTTTKKWFWKKERPPTLQIGMVLEGVHGRSLRIGGHVGTDIFEGIVTPIISTLNTQKRKEYEMIGFDFFEDNIEGSNCVGNLLHSSRNSSTDSSTMIPVVW